tara:strand:- start:558 stop:854 length:297 start_codon:yes stop_codon:yes gene_type:complete
VIRKTIKKIDIIKNLSFQTGFSQNFSKKIINDLIEIIILNISLGNLILKNIGSFKLKRKKEREGRNPKTKEKFIISARKSIIFIPSKNISKNVNKFNG